LMSSSANLLRRLFCSFPRSRVTAAQWRPVVDDLAS
jgi:hypothetical protein